MTSRAHRNGANPAGAATGLAPASNNGHSATSTSGRTVAPRAMILAAGQGTRLRPLTDRLPKAMVPIAGVPLLEHTIRLLVKSGVRDVAINVHSHADVIADYFGDGSGFGANILYSFEPQLLGTAGAVKALEPFFAGGPFFVVYGDVFTLIDPMKLMHQHRQAGALVTIALRRPDDATQCGIVRQDAGGWITEFIEKPDPGEVGEDPWANAGLYVLDPAVLRDIAAGGPQDFGRDVFNALARRDRTLFGLNTDGACWDIGSVDRLRQVDVAVQSTRIANPRRHAIRSAVDQYLGDVVGAVDSLDRAAIVRAAELLFDARDRGSAVYVIGNGGSATTASHMAADLCRATAETEGLPLNCRSLSDNVAILSAWANDVGYESVFTLQLAQVLAPGDVVVAFSASGKSPNIMAAVELAHSRGASVLGLSGFGGGPLAQEADVALVVGSADYGPVEDVHLLLNHLLATAVRRVPRSQWDAERVGREELVEPDEYVHEFAAAAG